MLLCGELPDASGNYPATTGFNREHHYGRSSEGNAVITLEKPLPRRAVEEGERLEMLAVPAPEAAGRRRRLGIGARRIVSPWVAAGLPEFEWLPPLTFPKYVLYLFCNL